MEGEETKRFQEKGGVKEISGLIYASAHEKGRWFTRTFHLPHLPQEGFPPVDASAREIRATLSTPSTRLHVMFNGGVPAKASSKVWGGSAKARDLPST